MHDINLIRDNPKQFIEEMKKRYVTIDIKKILNLDETKRAMIAELQELQNKRNNFSKSIAQIKNNKEEVERIIIKVNKIKFDMKQKEEKLNEVSNQLNLILLNLPNCICPEVPIGEDDSFNKIVDESNQFEKKKKTSQLQKKNWT